MLIVKLAPLVTNLPVIENLTVTDLKMIYHDLSSQTQATAVVAKVEGSLQEIEKSLKLCIPSR